MATYTITVNERTKEGRGLVRYLKKGNQGTGRGERHSMQYI